MRCKPAEGRSDARRADKNRFVEFVDPSVVQNWRLALNVVFHVEHRKVREVVSAGIELSQCRSGCRVVRDCIARGIVSRGTRWKARNTGVEEAVVKAKWCENPLCHESSEVRSRQVRRDGGQCSKTDIAIFVTGPGRVREPAVVHEERVRTEGCHGFVLIVSLVHGWQTADMRTQETDSCLVRISIRTFDPAVRNVLVRGVVQREFDTWPLKRLSWRAVVIARRRW